MKKNVCLILAYDGTDFAGWQIQEESRTVQGVLEEVLSTMHKHPVPVTAAGRTDAGVHATGQVVNFYTELKSIKAVKFRDAINYYLPDDVKVLESYKVDDDFHARFSARVRIYRYYYYFGEVYFPHYHRFAVLRRRRPNLQKINRMASVLIGEHDFTTFAGSADKSRSKKRIIYSSCFYPSGDFLVYKIAADSFLYRMVRSIAGTILDLNEKGWCEEKLKEILLAKKRSLAGTTAPARGLFLDKVLYDGEENII